MNSESHQPLKDHVMHAIKDGTIRMKPRSHFLLLSVCVLIVLGVLLLVATGIASLSVFSLYDSGLWFVPAFGARGWQDFWRALPAVPFALVIVIIAAIVMLIRRFAFGYRRPVVTAVFVSTSVVAIGAFALAPLHRSMEMRVRHGEVPPLVALLYHVPFRPVRPADLFHGVISSTTAAGFILTTDQGPTTTIVITKGTRLPYGGNFSVGEEVVVIGDSSASGTVRAFGVSDAK